MLGESKIISLIPKYSTNLFCFRLVDLKSTRILKTFSLCASFIYKTFKKEEKNECVWIGIIDFVVANMNVVDDHRVHKLERGECRQTHQRPPWKLCRENRGKSSNLHKNVDFRFGH
jgi:hypothetical protein